MPGIFDGMRISRSGINLHRVMEEVVGQNIANASNKNYTRQQVVVDSKGSISNGNFFFGQGVEATDITRLRDELLDGQVRDSSSTAKTYESKLEWLNKLESVFNEPSDNGINAVLSQFWESWSELANDPQSLATRSNMMTKTENLTRLMNNADEELGRYINDLDENIAQEIKAVNSLTQEIAGLNKNIFESEAGDNSQANDLRDRRDAAINSLSEYTNVRYHEDRNGMVNVMIGTHPAVTHDSSEDLIARSDNTDASKIAVFWEHGDRYRGSDQGSLSALFTVRDQIIPGYQAEFDEFANLLLTEVNQIYSNGNSLSPSTMIESRLGYEAFGVTNSTTALNLAPTGETRSINISFHDSNENVVRGAGIVIDENDTLADVASKLNAIEGLSATVLSDTNNDGKLRLQFDATASGNVMNETAFSLNNHTSAFDSSGLLSMLGFDTDSKSTNLSAAAPVMTSVDLSTLQTQLGEASVADVRSKDLNLAGTFYINAFETGSETTPKTDGHMVQQLAINVVSTDSIDDVMAKINALSATHGVAMTFNGVSNKLELTSTAQTDSEGNVLLAGGTDYLRLGFYNGYTFPADANDTPPLSYNGLADNSNFFATMQANTLFSGSDAGNISLDERVANPQDVHSGFSIQSGDNRLALAINQLQHSRVSNDNQFTIGEDYGDFIASLGSEIRQTKNLSENETAMLENYLSERDSISGVNLDEELALMIQYQRSYEANARMFSTFSSMAEELLNLR
jgi:flagellar hook-associated protein FlgK